MTYSLWAKFDLNVFCQKSTFHTDTAITSFACLTHRQLLPNRAKIILLLTKSAIASLMSIQSHKVSQLREECLKWRLGKLKSFKLLQHASQCYQICGIPPNLAALMQVLKCINTVAGNLVYARMMVNLWFKDVFWGVFLSNSF